MKLNANNQYQCICDSGKISIVYTGGAKISLECFDTTGYSSSLDANCDLFTSTSKGAAIFCRTCKRGYVKFSTDKTDTKSIKCVDSTKVTPILGCSTYFAQTLYNAINA
jgi:hypothetical protein